MPRQVTKLLGSANERECFSATVHGAINGEGENAIKDTVTIGFCVRQWITCRLCEAPILMTSENRSLLQSPPFYSAHGPLPKLYYASRGEQTTGFLGGQFQVPSATGE